MFRVVCKACTFATMYGDKIRACIRAEAHMRDTGHVVEVRDALDDDALVGRAEPLGTAQPEPAA